MTDHPAGTVEDISRPALAGRRPGRVLSLRDLRDVERYVIETIQDAALPLSDRHLDELVAAGIESIYRLERALPPQRPLLPLLQKVLLPRLVELWGSLELDAAAPTRQAAAIAA